MTLASPACMPETHRYFGTRFCMPDCHRFCGNPISGSRSRRNLTILASQFEGFLVDVVVNPHVQKTVLLIHDQGLLPLSA
jgi:hypothetical protein